MEDSRDLDGSDAAPGREFPVAPLKPLAWLLLPAIAVPAVLVSMLPPHGTPRPSPLWLVFIAVLLGALALAMRRRRIRVEDGALAIDATLYGQRVPVAALDLAQARIVSLREDPELMPVLGINRFGPPGLRAGYYRLRNGQRAFCLLTSLDRVLVLPQRDGRALLLSPQDPGALLERLRGMAAMAARG
jgi:hypothetical protein